MLSAFDLNYLTAGSSSLLGIHSQTVQAIGEQVAKSAKQHRKVPKFRSFKRSLGWIPFKASGIAIEEDVATFAKQRFKLWKSRNLQGKIKTGCFAQDARGRWYLCVACEVEDETTKEQRKPIGIDLGLKTKLTLSTGEAFDRSNITKRYEESLARRQRAHKKRQTQNVHAKIKNSREDWNHKTTTTITRTYGAIIIGGVKSNAIKSKAKRLSKSVYDAAWHQLKEQLKYKARRLGFEYVEVNEAYTSQTCSVCSERTGPKGLIQLGVREWRCSNCGASHDRDVNAAQNILRLGLQTPKILTKPTATSREGILVF